MTYRLSPRSDAYCQKDQLGFNKYVDTLQGIIQDEDFKTPFCIGIFGKWGSGKTSFMHLLEKGLLESDSTPYIIPVWFNPWRYKKEEHLIIPFLKTIESEIDGYVRLKKTEIKKPILNGLSKAAQKIGHASEAILYGIKADLKMGPVGLQFDAAKSIDREDALAKKQLEEAKKLSDDLSSIYYDIVTELKSAVNEQEFRIAVFIDDLDRCLPEKAVELLESIKLFIDLEGYLFIMGVDKNVVTQGISYHYRFFESGKGESEKRQIISPDDYLDKMIQLPFELPPIEPGKKRLFIESLLGDETEFNEHSDIIEVGIGENPRSLKRFINLLAFTVRLAETIKKTIIDQAAETPDHIKLIEENFIPILYIKWAIIVFRFPKVHQDIRGNRKRLIELQTAAQGEEVVNETEEDSDGQRAIELDERLKRVLAKGRQFPDDEWLLDRFVHLTESTVIREKESETADGYKQSFVAGDTVKIPRGRFLYGKEKIEKSIDYDYFIDVFPVTNKRYKEFLDENKNLQPPYVEKDWAESYNWDKETRSYPEGKSDHPVVLVSYEDAEQFCKWRSQKEGKEYRLPLEEEWEKAARGTDGREYPWGNEFGHDKCNTDESGIGGTTEVTRYPDGSSPFGCYDMAGNVWEWMKSFYDKSKETITLRGGSWDDNRYSARCAYRDRSLPSIRRSIIGFRCARA
jgi:formylglycine-generating enzyme required for sulfatase activity